MLHITNGHSVAGTLGESDVSGDIAVWADVLHEGPCPADLDDESWRRTRAEFLTTCGWFDFDRNLETLRHWDADFDACADHDEVVLWFEHDLYDQLILIRHLARLSQLSPLGPLDPRGRGCAREAAKLSLICIGEYPGLPNFRGLGELTHDQLVSLLDTRQPITDAMLDLGRRAWQAFTSPDPRAIEALLNSDTSPLPFLAAALHRHLEQLPSTRNGLGRTEQRMLDALADGPRTGAELFRHDTAAEAAAFMGDATFWVYIKRLAAGPAPLVTIERPVVTPTLASMPTPTPTPTPGARDDFDAGMAQARVALTDHGRAVGQGAADQLARRGAAFDRWYGGARLTGAVPAYRWDSIAGRVVAAS